MILELLPDWIISTRESRAVREAESKRARKAWNAKRERELREARLRMEVAQMREASRG